MSQRSGRGLRAAGPAVPVPTAVLWSIAVWFLLAVMPASAGVQAVGALGARVDWGSGEVRVTATVAAPRKSKPAALRASALSLAQANLKRLLAQLKGGGDTYAVPDDAAKVAAWVGAAKVASSGPVPGGRYQVILAAVLPKVASTAPEDAPQATVAPGRRSYTDPDPAQVRTFPAPPPTGEESLLTPADGQGPFTGVIVDTRSFSLRNSMSPRLLDSAFRDVYNGAHASVDYVEDVGVVGYMGSIAAALKNPRVGGRPLVIRAIGVADQHRTCPVISLDDAKRFLSDGGAPSIISKCAVCFIIDSLAARDR